MIESILYDIVRSKRLLADHVDVLDLCYSLAEEFLPKTTKPSPNNFTFLRATTISTLAALSISTIKCVEMLRNWINLGVRWVNWIRFFRFFRQSVVRFAVPIAAATYGVCYATKLVNQLKIQRTKNHLHGIIADLDGIDSAIRRNISYFREMNLLKSHDAPVNRYKFISVAVCSSHVNNIPFIFLNSLPYPGIRRSYKIVFDGSWILFALFMPMSSY